MYHELLTNLRTYLEVGPALLEDSDALCQLLPRPPQPHVAQHRVQRAHPARHLVPLLGGEDPRAAVRRDLEAVEIGASSPPLQPPLQTPL